MRSHSKSKHCPPRLRPGCWRRSKRPISLFPISDGMTAVTLGHFADTKPVDAKPQQIEPLPTTAETWLLAPVEAPDFSLPDFGGQVRTLSSLRGKPVLLNFWAAGAERCKGDWIAFNQHYAAWAAQGLQLLSVNLDGPAEAEIVRALVREHRLSFPILHGSEDVAGIYNIVYRYLFDRHRDLELPTSFLI